MLYRKESDICRLHVAHLCKIIAVLFFETKIIAVWVASGLPLKVPLLVHLVFATSKS